jgi:hypothetical protein
MSVPFERPFGSVPFGVLDVYRIYCSTFSGFGVRCSADFLFDVRRILHGANLIWDYRIQMQQGDWVFQPQP